MSIDKEVAEFLSGVVGVVDANSFEEMVLWREHTEKHGKESWDTRTEMKSFSLHRKPSSKRTTCFTLTKVTIGGHRYVFLDPTSQLVDHSLIDKWLDQKMPVTAFRENDPRKYLNRTNAMNFSNVLK